MSEYTIENDEMLVSVDEHASEIHSFKDKKTNMEYMWQGDPAFWAGRNPTLFPMVGSTWNKEVHIKGNTYHMGNHGFMRQSEFKCVKHTADEIVMERRSDADTLAQYPYEFTVRNTYRLDGRTLRVEFSVVNDNGEVMPFNFGWHPAFNCPLKQGQKQSDYHIVMEREETVRVHGEADEVTDTIELRPEQLKKTLIMTEPKSTTFDLTDGVHGIRMSAEGYRWVAIWSPEAPFVCIEPWYSHGDFEKVEVPFEEREGTQFLDPGCEFTAFYTITAH